MVFSSQIQYSNLKATIKKINSIPAKEQHTITGKQTEAIIQVTW